MARQRPDLKGDPQKVTIMLLDEIAQRLADLLPEEGVAEPYTFNVTDRTYKFTPKTPLFTIDFENSGPDSVYIRINDEGSAEREVQAMNSYYVYMGGAKIKIVYLRCASGDSATVTADTVR